MKVVIPPIKIQGIKTKLVPWILEIAPKIKGVWIEPFLGSGVVAFSAGFKQAVLNDSNPHIIQFYKNIQNNNINATLVRQYLEQEGELLRKADENGYVHYRKVRSRFNIEFSSLDFLFLSRAGFNGMMRFGKKGNWNIPFCKKPDRFAQAYITKITNQVANISKIIQPQPNWNFHNESFEKIIPLATENDFIYCDPPYLGRYADYYNSWIEKVEAKLFELLKETKAKFILSTWSHNDYRQNEMIKKYWNYFNIVTRDHFYHSGGNIQNRKTVVEALVCNFNLSHIQSHNHGLKIENPNRQLVLELS